LHSPSLPATSSAHVGLSRFHQAGLPSHYKQFTIRLLSVYYQVTRARSPKEPKVVHPSASLWCCCALTKPVSNKRCSCLYVLLPSVKATCRLPSGYCQVTVRLLSGYKGQAAQETKVVCPSAPLGCTVHCSRPPATSSFTTLQSGVWSQL